MRRCAEQPIDVHLVGLPAMLQDVVRDALADEVFDLSTNPPGPRGSAKRTVVVMRSGAASRSWREQLVRRPDASILLIEPRACHAELIELRPDRRLLGAVDMAAIVDAVRSATRWDDRLSAVTGAAGS